MLFLAVVILVVVILVVVGLMMVILVVVGLMMTKVVCSNTSPQRAAPLSRPNQTSTANCTLGERTHKWTIQTAKWVILQRVKISAVTTVQSSGCVNSVCVCVEILQEGVRVCRVWRPFGGQ